MPTEPKDRANGRGARGVDKAMLVPPRNKMLHRERVKERRSIKRVLHRCAGWEPEKWPEPIYVRD